MFPPYLRRPDGRFLPRTYVCYRTSAPVRVDGCLEEKAWWDAPWTEPFEDHQAPNAPPPARVTRAAMLWDDENLYFAARLQEENVWGSIVQRDAVIYLDNDFEIFLDPDGNGANYYELELNALNTAWDMFHPKEYHRRSCLETRYDIPGLRHAVQVQGTLNWHHDVDTGWTVEVSWPWRALVGHRPGRELPPRRGAAMRANFSRVQYPHDYRGLTCGKIPGSRCEDWIWNSTNSGDLHLPEMWGRILFTDRVAGSAPDLELEAVACSEPLAPPPRPAIAGPEMVYLPAGPVMVGPDPSDPEPSPAHRVTLGGYWIDRCPVTVAEFAAFLNSGGQDQHYFEFMANPHECGILCQAEGRYQVAPGRERHPVVYVTYPAAAAYAAWAGKQLPTEAQWERAARGLEGRTYPWGEAPPTPDRLNCDFAYGGTTEVGAFPTGATPEGILDLAGNVKEWCRDTYDSYPGGAPMLDFTEADDLDEHQQASLTRELYAVRGGGWTKQTANVRSAYRDADGPGRWFFSLGFRCVREDPA